MSERPTLLSRGGGAPTVQPTQSGAVQGSFGDYRGVIAAGQGLSDAANAASAFAINAKRAQTAEQMQLLQDLKVIAANDEAARQRALAEQKRLEDQWKAQNKRDIAAKYAHEQAIQQQGVREALDLALSSDNPPADAVAYLDQIHGEAQTATLKRTEKLRADPLFPEAVNMDAAAVDDINFRNSLLGRAIDSTVTRNRKERLDRYAGLVTSAFNASQTPEAKFAKGEALAKSIAEDAMDPAAKRQLIENLGANLYTSLSALIALGTPVDPAKIRFHSLLNEAQQLNLLKANEELKPKPVGIEDQNRIINEGHQILADGGTMSVEQTAAYARAVGSIDATYKDPGAAEARKREVINEQRSAAAFGYLGAYATEQGTYEDSTSLSTALLTNDSAVKHLSQMPQFKDLDWSSVPSAAITKYRTQAFNKVSAVVEAFKNFQATKILDSVSTVKGSANLVVTSMRRAASATTQEEVALHAKAAHEAYKQYRIDLTAEYDKRGTPSDLRPMIPEITLSDLDNAYLQEQGSSAIAQFHNARAVFGREGTADIVRRFANSRTGTLRDKSHLAAFAATQHFALFGSADGTIDNTLKASDKAMFDVLSNLPEKRRQWSQLMQGQGGYDEISSKVYDSIYFESDPNPDKVLSGASISKARSKVQSLQAMGHALAWTFGEPSLLAGFVEMNKAMITDEALKGAKESGDRMTDFVTAGNSVFNRLSASMTVVKTSMPDNLDRVYSIVPSSMFKQERWFEVPTLGGAANASRFGEYQGEVIQAIGISLYGKMDRTGLGNVADGATAFRNALVRHSWASWFSGTKINNSIHPLSPELEVPVGNLDIQPNYAGLGPNQSRLIHPGTWGVPGDRVTSEAMTISQHGAWKTNPSTGRYELMIRGAGQPVTGLDDVPNWSYRPVRTFVIAGPNKGRRVAEPVGFPLQSSINYHHQFRWNRSVGAAKAVFVDDPLTKENPDTINFAEAKLP